MTNKLKIIEINSWTVEQCVNVYQSLHYEGGGYWSSELVEEWIDVEDRSVIDSTLAAAYIESLEKTS